MSEKYTYAVARIRALEVSLFSNSTIDQLIGCQSYEQCLQFLEEKGWGDSETSGNAEAILTQRRRKGVGSGKGIIRWNGTLCGAFLSEAFS